MEALRSEFQENGVVKAAGLLTSAEVARLREIFDEIRTNPWKRAPGFPDGNEATGFRGMASQPGVQAFRDLLGEIPALAEACRTLWGSKSVWMYDHEIFHKQKEGPTNAGPDSVWWKGDMTELGKERQKQQQAEKHTAFHRDTFAVPFFGPHLANLWIPLDPEFLPRENSLQVIRKSHQTETVSSKEKLNWEEQDVASWDLAKGDVLIFHSHSLHGGGIVTKDFPERRSIVFRLFGDGAVFRPRNRSKNDRRYQGMQEGDHFSLAGAAVQDPRDAIHPLLLGPGLGGQEGAETAANAKL